MDKTVLVGVDVLHQSVLLRLRRQQHLEVLAVLHRQDGVEVRHVIERVPAVVHLVVHVEALGQVRRLDQGRDPALHRHVAAQVVGGIGDQPRGVRRETARRVLGRHDRDVQVLAELHVVVQVVVRERVFVPVVAQLFDHFADLQRLDVVVRPRGVEHHAVVVAHRGADGPADFDVLLDVRCGRVDLVRRPAVGLVLCRLLCVLLRRPEHGGAGVGRNAVPVRAQQLVDGQAGDLARDVPQSDVHRADGARGRVAAAGLQPLVQPLPVQRVLAKHDRLQVLDQRLAVEPRAAAGGAQEGVAFHALVRRDLDEPELARATEPAREPPVAGRRDALPVEEREREIRNLHCFVLPNGSRAQAPFEAAPGGP